MDEHSVPSTSNSTELEANGREPEWVSDAIVDILGDMGLEYIAINPGASLKGLHDSLVNYSADRSPEMLLCLHEEHAVAIAHGYAKVTGKPMAVALHSNVGLMHGTMAIYNAWCDRVPMLVLGATGPLDAMERRPWIDWIHTSSDQAALVRNFVKWDDTPTSPGAALESVLRAHSITSTAPCAPVYVSLDAALQEMPMTDIAFRPTADRYNAPPATVPAPAEVDRALSLLRSATNPLILVGRVGRDDSQWTARIQLAETLNARVLSDLKSGSTFPTDHALLVSPPQQGLTKEMGDAIRFADVILSLGWIDLGGTLRQVFDGAEPTPKIISCSNDDVLWNGWSKDHGGFSPADVSLHVAPDEAVASLVAQLGVNDPHVDGNLALDRDLVDQPAPPWSESLQLADLAETFRDVLAEANPVYLRLPLGWSGAWSHFDGPFDYLGYDGGGGLGSGPGMAVGAALALKESGRLPVAVLGDGDFMMGNAALWTAVHYRIPLLIIVANNQTYGNDEIHQARIARARMRPEERRWVGQRMSDPFIDYAALSRSQGCKAYGPVTNSDDVKDVLKSAVADVQAGLCVVVDVVVAPPTV